MIPMVPIRQNWGKPDAQIYLREWLGALKKRWLLTITHLRAGL
jgi:hypothetical protein